MAKKRRSMGPAYRPMYSSAPRRSPLGKILFIIATILAVLFGAFSYLTPAVTGFLFLLGLIVGLLNIQNTESKDFLMTGAILVVVMSIGEKPIRALPTDVPFEILYSIMLVLVPAIVIVALKEVFRLAKD
ncbi:MAG TPA: hypothetical protein VJG90_08485 [Candidatus Nanoarchaeia archaeon]|nr:hypothetical protein [Candidatus Nanoarchaeia archaeon]